MVYIQLADSTEGFDRLSITEFHYSGRSVVCKYKIYKDESIQSTHRLLIDDSSTIEEILNAKSSLLSGYDCLCKVILEYIVEEVKTGTIEVENG